MNLADLASIAGDISAVVLVITLVYLNLQVRQSDKNQRALIQQGRASRTVDIAMGIMSSDFAEVYYRCVNGDASISETQLVQFMGHCRAIFLGAEDSFLQNKQSQLDNLAFVSFTTSLQSTFVSPGVRAIWKMTREWYEPEFAVFMDIIVSEAVKRHPVDRLTQWKAIVSKEIDGRPSHKAKPVILELGKLPK
jgi:hypothetical protein